MKFKKIFQKAAAVVMAAVTVFSVLPATTAFAAVGDVGTISFSHTYDGNGNAMRYNSAVCLEGAIIVLACIIFSLFAAAPPVVNPDAAAVTMVWSYVGELIFNMLILVGAVKMADRVVREMMGL